MRRVGAPVFRLLVGARTGKTVSGGTSTVTGAGASAALGLSSRVLTYRLGALDPATRERIRTVTDLETLKLWYEEVLFLSDAEGAQRLAEKIRNAPLV